MIKRRPKPNAYARNASTKPELRGAHIAARSVVELEGFEPSTPCMPCRCSSQLSYSPKGELQMSKERSDAANRKILCPPKHEVRRRAGRSRPSSTYGGLRPTQYLRPHTAHYVLVFGSNSTVVRPTGFEPVASWTATRRSIRTELRAQKR